jgi:hypothetical protein
MAIEPKHFVKMDDREFDQKLTNLKVEQATKAMQDHWAKKVGAVGPTWIDPAPMTSTGNSFHELEARVKTLELKMQRMEQVMSDAGKSEWDRFEELTK